MGSLPLKEALSSSAWGNTVLKWLCPETHQQSLWLGYAYIVAEQYRWVLELKQPRVDARQQIGRRLPTGSCRMWKVEMLTKTPRTTFSLLESPLPTGTYQFVCSRSGVGELFGSFDLLSAPLRASQGERCPYGNVLSPHLGFRLQSPACTMAALGRGAAII